VHAGHVGQLVAQFLRRGDDGGVDQLECDPSRVDRAGADDLQRPQRFHPPVVGSRGDGADAGERSVGSLFGVDGVVLATPATVSLVPGSDLENINAGGV